MAEHIHAPSLFDLEKKTGKVECLGMTFESDDARRAYFLEKLQEKLEEPEFRKTEGFPIGANTDILAMSDPPYYTACPNPFLEEFIQHYGKPYDSETDDYHREPYAADVSEGKTDGIYTAHSYHTKVPHKAAARYILHYTNPGDVVLDGFAGSGMTGVAAQMCAKPDPDFKYSVETERQAADLPPVEWGARRVVLNDLSPAATFISANYNLPFDVKAFEREAKRILQELKQEIGWMYETTHTDGKTKGQINYTVWSQVFSCPECATEITFLEEALDLETYRVKDIFPCPNCSVELNKDKLLPLKETLIDLATNKPWQRIRFTPVLVNYTIGKTKHEKHLGEFDLNILSQVEQISLPATVPTDSFPIQDMYHGSRLSPKGFTSIHHLFLMRNAQALGRLWEKTRAVADTRIRNMLLFWLDSHIVNLSIQNRYRPGVSFPYNPLNGVYYISSLVSEANPFTAYENKLKRIITAFKSYLPKLNNAVISTGDCGNLYSLPESCIDYIFTDPPFGENIFYADLNFLVESWYRVRTDTNLEAIIDKPKHKDLFAYQRLMQNCFEEYYRVLKPGRWMTVVFHNSRSAVWNAIQEAMLAAKFVIAGVRTLDKQQGSYRQVTSTAVKQDLVITAYKPSQRLENDFNLEKGTEEGAWNFIRTHLQQLPVFVADRGQSEMIAERLDYLLFDRMVAFHIQRGATIPLSAAEFYAGLSQRFPSRDGMYFLPEQVAEYDRKRLTVKEILQLDLFVNDESSAILWLKQKLTAKPQTFAELQPQFLREKSWVKYDREPDLRDQLLAENFLCFKGEGKIPRQIVRWLKQSSHYREKIRQFEEYNPSNNGLETDDPELLNAAKDRWYVPNPNQAEDLEKLRERALLKEFEEYRQASQKQLKVIRLEAVRVGFKRAWQERDYMTIINVARRIPENILQEDPKLLMWYDQSLTRAGED